MKFLRPRIFVAILALVCLSVLGTLKESWGHHGGGGATSTALQQSIGERFNPPATNVFFNFSVNNLDNGLGWVLLYQIEGSYAVTKKFSVGARLPFWSVRQDFLPNNDRIGDVALLFKGQVWRAKNNRMSLNLGMDVSFPTGSDTESLGAGVITLGPYVTWIKDFQVLQMFINVVKIVELGSAKNPTLGYELGLQIPMIKGALPLDFFLGFSGSTWIASDTFINGSTKGFVNAGLLLELTDNWEAAFLGRVSVIDSISLKSGIPFSDFATGLLSDVRAGFSFNLGYVF